jgi:3-deoxy-D-manno-octulosonate 8-phosphate phosphatase KdsC-like HAD superfamily phosphatase
VGITFCPSDAYESILKISDYVLNTKGGDGVIRELYDIIINTKRRIK